MNIRDDKTGEEATAHLAELVCMLTGVRKMSSACELDEEGNPIEARSRQIGEPIHLTCIDWKANKPFRDQGGNPISRYMPDVYNEAVEQSKESALKEWAAIWSIRLSRSIQDGSYLPVMSVVIRGVPK